MGFFYTLTNHINHLLSLDSSNPSAFLRLILLQLFMWLRMWLEIAKGLDHAKDSKAANCH
jgi:hypothetical protein